MAHVAFPFEKFKLHPQYLVLVQNAVFLKKLAGKIALPTDFLLKFMIHYLKNLDAKLFQKIQPLKWITYKQQCLFSNLADFWILTSRIGQNYVAIGVSKNTPQIYFLQYP